MQVRVEIISQQIMVIASLVPYSKVQLTQQTQLNDKQANKNQQPA